LIARPVVAITPCAFALAASLVAASTASAAALPQGDPTAGEGRDPLASSTVQAVVVPTRPSPPLSFHLGGGVAAPGSVLPLIVPTQAATVRVDSWWAPAASAILPGSGQAVLRQDRAIGYLAAEAYGWIRFAADLREARRQRSAYRQLAATVARAYFDEVKPSGNFEYYERMEHFVESGVFDASVVDGTQPETDPETFNGSLWLRARSTFWEDPTVPPPAGSDPYLSAVRYYEERAIRPEFRWSWRDAQLEQDLFRRTIDRSNDAYRRSLQDLGVILANHVLSTVDAYVTLRIRRLRRSPERVGVVGTILWSPDLGFGSRGGDGR
jgi:hypothetical protein